MMRENTQKCSVGNEILTASLGTNLDCNILADKIVDHDVHIFIQE